MDGPDVDGCTCSLQLELCEDITVHEFRKSSIFLRVLKENEVAKKMYSDMGYVVLEPKIAGDPPEVLLMGKDLRGRLKAPAI